MAYITGSNLSIGYDGQKILTDLQFTIKQGDYLCILGENGAGKSTLMKTILNLIPPVSGTITLGEGITHTDIGYLPQQSIVQRDFPASVKEIVLSGCQGRMGIRPFYNKEAKEHAAKNMEKMGISNLSNRCYRELSGGQQQRVLLARALCATNKILLLDEPVAGLDPQATKHLYTLIKSLNEEGITIIMISHDIDAAAEYATRIMNVSKGGITWTK